MRRHRARLSTGFWLVILAAACFNPSHPRVGGESHWLAECREDQDCSDGLSCVCDTCTRACTKDAACFGDRDAACYDARSPLLLQRCEDRVNESNGVCLARCLLASDCGDTRTCMQGTCVPLTKTDVPGASDGGVQIGATSAEVSWSEPIQVPVLPASIAGGDDSIVGVWRQTNCGDPNVPGMFECMLRLEIVRNAQGTITGSVYFGNRAPNASGPFAPATDPDVGYPTGVDVARYGDLYFGTLVDTPYRMLDGRFASGHLTFEWTAFDPWHDWCRLQTPHPWQVADRQFYFCVPQDEDARAGFDHGKVALCTSADFLKRCTNQQGSRGPCVCMQNAREPAQTQYLDERYDAALCSPAYCHCDAQGCDVNSQFVLSGEDFVVTGEQMTGTWYDRIANGPLSTTFERSQP